jgi:tetratricopeptide (TPR) repeat protein/DNA-binding XRE family transcriptional regulator
MEQADGQFFGEVLRRFRKKKMTQQRLATLIGVNRDSVSSWERGEYFPETSTMLYEIARVLHLSEDEKRLLFEARYGTASMLPLHNLPEHNPYFTGREEILSHLHAHLISGKQVALVQTQAISGLGGIGKTQVAIEYAYRFREHYHDILWVVADSREALVTSYLVLARLLRPHEREEREQQKVVEAVKRWLREHKGWLLILDNIEDLGLVHEFLPTPRQGSVILTTRRAETKPIAEALVLEALPDEEGSLFLLRRAGYLLKEASLLAASAAYREAARALVQAVGGLPLALDQAGAYIAETKCSLSDYLDLFKQEQKMLLLRRGTVPTDHPQSVTTTFALAFEQVHQKNEASIELLLFCAFLAPDAIPLEVITEGATSLGRSLEEVTANAFLLDQALETLQAYSLIQRDGERRTLSLHRLVQAVLQDTLEKEEQRRWAERVILAANAVFPHVEHKTWPQCERLLTQAMVAAQWIKQYQFMSEEAARLLGETASYLQARARYREAEPLYQRALHIREQSQGPEHPQVAYPLNNLANLYMQQGKYAEAEPLYQRALHIREQNLGPEHPQVAYPLNGLANLYKDRGKYAEAEPLYQRALHIREQQLGLQHPDTAETLHDFAAFQERQGNHQEALSLYQRAFNIRERVLGPEHPKTGVTYQRLTALRQSVSKGVDAPPQDGPPLEQSEENT